MRKPADQRVVTQDQLTRQMSDVISLREKVAQAELAAHLYGVTVGPLSSEPTTLTKRTD